MPAAARGADIMGRHPESDDAGLRGSMRARPLRRPATIAALALGGILLAPLGLQPPGGDARASNPMVRRGRADAPATERSRATRSVESDVSLSGVSPSAYHGTPRSACTDCHVSGSGDGAAPRGRTMLRLEPVNLLCLDCHDGTPGIPDVLGADINGLRERSGGYFDALGSDNPRGHDLLESSDALAASALCSGCHGAQPRSQLACVDCHDPHGNGNPRHLRSAATSAETPAYGLFNPPGLTGLAKYERENVAYGTLNSERLREVSSLCVDCHHGFSGVLYTGSGPGRHHVRHPSYDSEHGAQNSIAQGAHRESTDPAHWIRGVGSGFNGTTRVPFVVNGAIDFTGASRIDPGSNGVFCLSCHKAHGSGSAFGLTWPIRHGRIDRTGCDQCHAIKSLPDDSPSLAADTPPTATR